MAEKNGTARGAIYTQFQLLVTANPPKCKRARCASSPERRGWQLVESYIDEGFSGSKSSRPALDRLMADAHRRKFDVIIVWKFDRFARSVSHLLRALETFNALGIAFVSLSESLDTSTPAGKMVFTVLGAVAELERSLIVERVKAGLRNARAKGKRLGRPRCVVDASRIGQLRARGVSWHDSASDGVFGQDLPSGGAKLCFRGIVTQQGQKPSSAHSCNRLRTRD